MNKQRLLNSLSKFPNKCNDSIDIGVTRFSARRGVAINTTIQQFSAHTALKHNFKFMHLKHGSTHDAASMGHKVPMDLLFVPSIKGLSHCAQKNTKPEYIATKAIILEESVRILCTQ